MSPQRRRWVLVALLVAGCGLMIPFDLWATRLAGMTLLATFIVLGVFTVAEPRFLSADESEAGGRPRGG